MRIKFKFYYQWLHKPPILRSCTIINDLPRGVRHPYYLLSVAMSADYICIEHCDLALSWIAKIEHGEVDIHVWEGQDFIHTITYEKVSFEHTIFGECEDWPIWSCPLSHYKALLQGWRQFLEMPKGINSELVIDLPEVA